MESTTLVDQLRACSARVELPEPLASRQIAACRSQPFVRLPQAIEAWWGLDADLRVMTQIGIDPALPVGREGELIMMLAYGDVLRVSDLLGL